MPSIDEFIAAGLYDPATMADTGRLELLAWLDEQGFTVEQMRIADCSMALGALAGDRALAGDERLTKPEAAERAGLSVERFDPMHRALGFVDLDVIATAAPSQTWAADEAVAIAHLASLSTMFSDDEAAAFMRVIGTALARIGDAAVALFLNDVESRLVNDGSSELVLAKQVHDATRLIDGMGDQFEPILRRHVLQSTQRSRRAIVDDKERFVYRYAIGFVDLVGFTSISGDYDPPVLASFIREFEARAHDAVAAHGARVVKLIGDEVMFAATDASAACRAAAELMSGFGSAGDHVLPRGGVAFGEMVVRGGDFYGSVVNLAARLTDQAVPQEVLVTEEVVAAADDLQFVPAGRRMLKGFEAPVAVASLDVDTTTAAHVADIALTDQQQ